MFFIHQLHLYYQPSNGCLIYQLMCRSTQADWAADPSTLNGVQTISTHLAFVFSRTEERSAELKMAQVCNLEGTKLWAETFDRSWEIVYSIMYTCAKDNRIHTYPQHFLKFLTWPLTVVYYKVNYLPVGVRIWFWPNCRIRVFGDMANYSSEIG